MMNILKGNIYYKCMSAKNSKYGFLNQRCTKFFMTHDRQTDKLDKLSTLFCLYSVVSFIREYIVPYKIQPDGATQECVWVAYTNRFTICPVPTPTKIVVSNKITLYNTQVQPICCPLLWDSTLSYNKKHTNMFLVHKTADS